MHVICMREVRNVDGKAIVKLILRLCGVKI
jgi:hypothetical protein